MSARPTAGGALRRLPRATSRRPVLPDFRGLVEGLQHAVILTDAELEPPGPTILYVNPAFTRLTGYAPEEVIGRSPRLLQGPGTDRITLRSIGSALRLGEGGQWKLLNQGRDGTPYWAELRIAPLRAPDGTVEQFAGFQRPSHPTLEWGDGDGARDGRDALTGLSDRRALAAEVLRHLRGEAAAQLCLVHLGVDHFRALNEAVDPPVGDAVLLAFADILSASLRRSDGLARIGAEEFAICMPGIRLVEARGLAERLRRIVETEPFATPAGPLPVTCSLGMTMGRPGESVAELLERAGAALDAARREGGNRLVMG
ncbi:GGDEF domain-containing protein [Roseococcus sp. SYP-B2431]|uniref:GGDEF domain-containing protein n=1 Tax=Roseococcus sp. SYP-B2431 TaxID=2496640 RepID=UPI0013F47107|nr:GGDEF domain-containing protein [Roseococcus sp. SYP-B2431]